jgi:hypothetical protein
MRGEVYQDSVPGIGTDSVGIVMRACPSPDVEVRKSTDPAGQPNDIEDVE